MALVKTKGSSNWYSRFTLNKKVYSKSTRTANKQIAERIDKQHYEEVLRFVELGDLGSITLKEAADNYCDRPNVKEKVQYGDKRKTKKIMDFINPDMNLHEIRHYHITQMIDGFLRDGVSNSYINNISSTFRMMVKYARAKGYKTPEVELPRLKVVKKRIRYLTYDEELILLNELNPDIRHEEEDSKNSYTDWDAYDFAILCLDSGVRCSEALFLSWSSIDFKTKTFRVYRPKVDNESVLYFTDRIEQMLKRRFAKRTLDDKKVFNVSDDRLIPNRILYAVNKHSFNSVEILKNNGGVRANVHTLRKTFASRLVMNGTSIEIVSKILGHSSIQMTQDHYAFLAPDMGTEDAAATINNLTNQNLKPTLVAVQ